MPSQLVKLTDGPLKGQRVMLHEGRTIIVLGKGSYKPNADGKMTWMPAVALTKED